MSARSQPLGRGAELLVRRLGADCLAKRFGQKDNVGRLVVPREALGRETCVQDRVAVGLVLLNDEGITMFTATSQRCQC